MTIHCAVPDPRDPDGELIDIEAFVREHPRRMVVENAIASDGTDLLPLLHRDEVARIRHMAIEADVERGLGAVVREMQDRSGRS